MHENFKCLATAIFEVPKAGRYDTAKKFSKNASKATTAVHRDQNMTLTTTDYCSLFAGFTGSEWLGMTNLEQG
jgi:hypothetical protein